MMLVSWSADSTQPRVSKRGLWQMPRLAWEAQPACLVGLLLLELTQALTPLGSAWLTKLLFDRLAAGGLASGQGQLSQTLLLLLLGLAALLILGQSCEVARNYLTAELNRQLGLTVQLRIYGKINGLAGLAPFEDPQLHNTIQLAAQGAQMGPAQALSTFSALLRGLLTLGSFLVVLLALSPLLAGLICLTALPQLLLQLRAGRQRFDVALANTPRQRRTFYYGNVLSSVQYAKELRLFGLAGYFLDLYERLGRDVHAVQRRQQLREARWQLALALIAAGTGGLSFAYIIVQALQGQLSLGDVLLYTTALPAIQGALNSLVFSLSTLNELALFFSRFTELLALPDPLTQLPCARLAPPLRQGIELRGVSFRYSETLPWVLRDIDLTIPAGQCTALVGLNGEGKSTLVKLLMRFYDPVAGQILWDGVDLRELDLASLRRRIGAIFQDFARYDLTLQENIALGHIEHINHPERIELAARQSGADQLVDRLPQGYQTTLSRWLAEDGAGVDLSGGQWQKVALARMFMRDADLLVLDEPSSALDAQAESEIYERLLALTHDRTSLLISHRLSTVRMADQIAVLEDGRVSEYGNHELLLCGGGAYARLYSLQAERYR
jgi:ATP-binding cassette subfamily B protein